MPPKPCVRQRADLARERATRCFRQTNLTEFHKTKRFMASLLAVALAAGFTLTLRGCNAIAGVGEDIEKGGAAIKNEASEKR